MKKGKFTSLMLAGMMAVTTLAGCGSGGKQAASKVDTSEAAQGKVLNIYCWNTEFQDRFEYFKKSGKLPSDVKVNFVVTPNENNAYQNALDAALLKQNDVPADEKIDIFLIEADYALKYVDSDYTLDVVNDIGLSKDALADQYQYRKVQHGRQHRDCSHTDVPLQKMFSARMIRMQYRHSFLHGISLMP